MSAATSEIRPATPDELSEFLVTTAAGFLSDHPEPEEHFNATMDMGRTRAAFEGGRIVGTLGAFDLELALPGGTARCAGTTAVTVRTTHRRQGLLNRLMASHLDDVRDRGEPLAALWASESGIYSRFGYGCAADAMAVTVDRSRGGFGALAPDTSERRCRFIEPEEAAGVLPSLYDSGWRERPGCFARDAGWWTHRRFVDPPQIRQGASSYRYAVCEHEGEVRGAIQYRVKENWDQRGLPKGEVQVVEMFGGDPATRASLWRHVLDIDLSERLVAWNEPADSELPWLLADTRRATRFLRDSLWVRPVDVPTVLETRRYLIDDTLVIDVEDAFQPDLAGRVRLDAGPDGATCRTTSLDAEVTLDVSDLGALVLGGRSAVTLARAGRIDGDPKAIARLDLLLGWHTSPWCAEVF